MMAKVDCGTSETAEPLFPFLTSKLPDGGIVGSVLGSGIKWNFAKFLCNRDGIPVRRYSPRDPPLSFEKDIVALLQNVCIK
jgi:glutathione peroxidase